MYPMGMDVRFEPMVEALEALPRVGDPDGVAALLELLDQLTARIVVAVDELDRNGGAMVDGAVNTTAWLRTRGGRCDRDARLLLRRVARLRGLPEVTAAWEAGRLSTAHVDAVVAHVSARTVSMFAEFEADMVDALAPLTARDAATVMTRWAAFATAVVDGPAPPDSDRSLFLSPSLDGGGELSGRLDPAGFEVVDTALAAAMTDDADGEPRTPAQRRADALVAVCAAALDHGERPPTTRRRRPHVSVVVTLDELVGGTDAHTLDGRPVDAASLAAVVCDSRIHRFITDGASVVVDAGRAVRTVNHHLFGVLAVRDRGCRFPGCDRPVSQCEAHHVTPWQHGGSTDRDNLVLFLWRHKWSITFVAHTGYWTGANGTGDARVKRADHHARCRGGARPLSRTTTSSRCLAKVNRRELS